MCSCFFMCLLSPLRLLSPPELGLSPAQALPATPKLSLSSTPSSAYRRPKLRLSSSPRPPPWPWRHPPWAPRPWCPPQPRLLHGLSAGSSPPPWPEFSNGGWRRDCLSRHWISMPRSKVKTRPPFSAHLVICFTSCLATLLFLILWTTYQEFQLRVSCCSVLHRRGSTMAAQGRPTSLEKEHACLFTLIPLSVICYLVCCSCWFFMWLQVIGLDYLESRRLSWCWISEHDYRRMHRGGCHKGVRENATW
jgi:hypothetical protein